MLGIRRREFVGLLGGAAATWPIAVRAQPSTVPVVGFLAPTAPEKTMASRLAAFRQGLSETGFTEGRNLAIEYRWADNILNRLPELAADLVRLRVAVIFAFTVTAALAAKAATTTIPIVYVGGGDPVTLGLVSSLNRPDGNITGFSNIGAGLELKRFEILQQLLPGATRFAVLVDPQGATAQSIAGDVRGAAASRGLQIEVFSVSTARDIDIAFATLVQKQVAGLLVPPQPSFVDRRVQLVILAARHAVPVIYWGRDAVDAGGLMSYGTDVLEQFRQSALYVSRILKGQKPANLPVAQATTFDFVINLQTARTIGLEIPPTLLALATEVVE
jgi:putative tryptophan/tyrosine transport system substrate-binding protein